MSKEKSMKIANTLLGVNLIVILATLVLFFLPFQKDYIGLSLIKSDVLILLPFIFIVLSFIVSTLIFLIDKFPWGKIILIVISLLLLIAAILLFFVKNLNYGLILVSIFAITMAISTFIVALLK